MTYGHDVHSTDNATSCSETETEGGMEGYVDDYQYTFTKTGTFYFICDVPGHCAAGQRGSVVVVESGSSSTNSISSTDSSMKTTATVGPSSRNLMASDASSYKRLVSFGGVLVGGVVGLLVFL